MNGTEKKDLDLLIDGLQRMALKLSDQMIDQLMTYLNLVEKWNRVYNLTAIRERELALTNLDVVNSRVEDYQPITLFEAVTSRAFSNLKNMMSLTQHTLQKEGMWLAMKSKDVKEELEEFEKNQYTLIPLEVPFINAERYLVILKKDNF